MRNDTPASCSGDYRAQQAEEGRAQLLIREQAARPKLSKPNRTKDESWLRFRTN